MARTVLVSASFALVNAQEELERLEVRKAELMSELAKINAAINAASAIASAKIAELKDEAKK